MLFQNLYCIATNLVLFKHSELNGEQIDELNFLSDIFLPL